LVISSIQTMAISCNVFLAHAAFTASENQLDCLLKFHCKLFSFN